MGDSTTERITIREIGSVILTPSLSLLLVSLAFHGIGFLLSVRA